MTKNEKTKKLGQIYTPEWVVQLILERIGYKGKPILGKYVLEPGCGNGNFLLSIVQSYITTAKKYGYSDDRIKKDLESYIYGIEIDPSAYNELCARLDKLAFGHGLKKILWKVYNSDILDFDLASLPLFDFIIGNPPYVRIHNLSKDKLSKIRQEYSFCKSGIIDLFLVFFEIGVKSLKNNGRLGFITPNSFIHNSTYTDFREYLSEQSILEIFIDFKDNMVFDNASTYNAITILQNGKKKSTFDYYEYKDKSIELVSQIDLKELDNKKWNLTSKKNADFLFAVKDSVYKISDEATVQYGFATLRDRIYILKNHEISDGLFGQMLEKDLLFPVIKGSRYNGGEITHSIIYPYQYEGGRWMPIRESKLKKDFPKTFKYFSNHKDQLLMRSMDKGTQWFEYGRSQGIQSVHNEKLVISPIFKDKIKVYKVPKHVMVYSGMFLFPKQGSKYDLNYFYDLIMSDKFIKFARLVGKDMRGGYKTINTNTLKNFPLLI